MGNYDIITADGYARRSVTRKIKLVEDNEKQDVKLGTRTFYLVTRSGMERVFGEPRTKKKTLK